VPLKRGCNPFTFYSVFEKIVNATVSAYDPDCIVFQCGVDGLVGDPLGGWNLDSVCIGKCVTMVANFKLPILVLGGGGYNPINAAKCWAYCTLLLTNSKFENEIPEHDYWPNYQPDCELLIESQSFIKDYNLENNYLELMVNQILENINKIN
jgi:acetoin utilization deacetylase AcuC-like enzyme